MSCLMLGYITGVGRSAHYVQVTNFSLCKDPGLPIALSEQDMAVVPLAAEAVYVCGQLQADGYVSLRFLIAYEGMSKHWFILSQGYRDSGEILEQIPKEYWNRPGQYRVEVYWGQLAVAWVEFTVVDDGT